MTKKCSISFKVWLAAVRKLILKGRAEVSLIRNKTGKLLPKPDDAI
jgi:hypothetical protein